jgi:hypothetical protein
MYICKKDLKMINQVRNTVLSVLNKNNYGYISPSDFNLYAENAQMELYEEYFSSYNKATNMENARQAGSDYAEIEGPIAEVLETFLVTDFLSHSTGTQYISTNSFYAPSLTTTGTTAYYILKVLCHTDTLTRGANTSVSANQLVCSTGQFNSFGIERGDIVINASANTTARVLSVVSNSVISLDADIFTSTPQTYLIISKDVKEADKVSVGKITMLNSSLLTQPSNMFPSYTLEGEILKLYPDTISDFGQVECVYFRHPKIPKWTYSTLANGEPVFNQSQSDYQDFELPEEDGYKLAMKILQYCGMSIREVEVAQFGLLQEQHEQPTFSNQQ